MLLSVLVLAATLDPSAQATDAVKSAEVPASHSGVSQAALDAGFAAFKRRRFAEAEVDFRKAMEADPASAGPYFYLGYTYYKLAERKRPFHPDKEKAKQMFAKAYEMDPTFRPVWGEAKAKK
jgi:tetratricopeptide (TPR) repeat protein